VLQATAMPSVLIETGFISNPEEERYLNSEEGQKELSQCIIRALKNYVAWLEDKQGDESKDPKEREAKLIDNNPSAAAQTKEFLEMVEKQEREKRTR
jgi:N-acetylmuramoyl-L-alanine amidase